MAQKIVFGGFLLFFIWALVYSGMIIGRLQTNAAWEMGIIYHNSAKVRGDNYLCKKESE